MTFLAAALSACADDASAIHSSSHGPRPPPPDAGDVPPTPPSPHRYAPRPHGGGACWHGECRPWRTHGNDTAITSELGGPHFEKLCNLDGYFFIMYLNSSLHTISVYLSCLQGAMPMPSVSGDLRTYNPPVQSPAAVLPPDPLGSSDVPAITPSVPAKAARGKTSSFDRVVEKLSLKYPHYSRLGLLLAPDSETPFRKMST